MSNDFCKLLDKSVWRVPQCVRARPGHPRQRSRPVRQPRRRTAAAGTRDHQVVPRQRGSPGRRHRPRPRPGARAGRRERRRQVHVDEGARGRLPARRRLHRDRRGAPALRAPAAGPARRRRHGVPGVQPAAGPHHRAEHLPRSGAPHGPLVDTGRMRRDTAELLTGLGVEGLDPDAPVRTLSVAEQQIVEIAKAITSRPGSSRWTSRPRPWPTTRSRCSTRSSAPDRPRRRDPLRLPPAQGDLRPLRHHHRAQGRTVVTSLPAGELDESTLVRLMVGRTISAFFPDKVPDTTPGEVALRAPGARQRLRRRGRPGRPRWRDRGPCRTAGIGPHRAAGGDLRGAPVLSRRGTHRRAARDPAFPSGRRPGRAGPGHRGPQGHRSRPQPEHRDQRARRRPRGLPPAHERRTPGPARPAVLPRGHRPQHGPGGPVPLRWQPAEDRSRPVAGHQPPGGPARRAHARHRRGRQAGHLRADARPGRPRCGRPDGLQRAARGDRDVRPDRRDARRPGGRRAARRCERGPGPRGGDGARWRNGDG